jgi:alkanesulfonate monooxygenase SsuD/methylene tetrahydromethanopterin reductase-like flavin-dependent oxidoreductase (luciferase family)
MLRLVARHADRSNWWVCPQELFAKRTQILDQYCRKLRKLRPIEKSATALLNIAETQNQLTQNLKQSYRAEQSTRPFDEWRKDASSRMISGTPDQCLQQLRTYVDLGVTYFMLRPIDLPKTEGLRLFAETVRL